MYTEEPVSLWNYSAEINCETQNMPSTLLVADECLLDRDWLSSLQLDWKTIMNLVVNPTNNYYWMKN